MSLELFNTKMSETANSIRNKLGIDSKMTINQFPVNIENIQGLDKIPEVLDENEAYNNLRRDDWMAMPTTVNSNEIYMLFFIPTGIRSLLSFQITAKAGTKYQVSVGRMEKEAFVSQETTEILSGSLYENEFYGPDFPNNPITTDGFRQLMIKVTGEGILSFVPTPHSSKGNDNRSGWNVMEIACNVPQCTSFACGHPALTRALRNLTFFTKYGTSSISSFSYMFSFCSSLKVVRGITGNNNIKDVNHMFYNCHSLVAIPNINFGGISGDAQRMFAGCWSIQRIRDLDLSRKSICESLFSDCESLVYMGTVNCEGARDCNNVFLNCKNLIKVDRFVNHGSQAVQLFSGCSRLVSVGELDIRPANAPSIFDGCSSLIEAPYFDTSRVSVFAYVFRECRNLTTVPEYDLSNNSIFVETFKNCHKLVSVPNFNMNKATQVNEMFSGCASLEKLPETFVLASLCSGAFYNCKSLTTIDKILDGGKNGEDTLFSGCSSLITIKQVNVSSSMKDTFLKCYSLSKLTFNPSYMPALKSNDLVIDLSDCSIGYQSIKDLLASLPSNTTGYTAILKIAGNRGAVNLTAADKAIATNKGWTLDV